MKRMHGGDWAAFQEEQGVLPLDFSANISPLGVPPAVQAAIWQAAATADRYPDPTVRTLHQALSVYEDVPADWLLCGSGAADLIWRACLAARPKRALVTAPSFGEYEAALEACGCETLRFPLEDDFVLPDRILSMIDSDLDMLILCNPNNPTGRTADPSLLCAVAKRCGETGTRLLLDECFVDFLDEPEKHTMKPLLENTSSLLILKAFTKLWGMAGVRLGYALCADVSFLDAIRSSGPPWSVSTLSQAAGLAALQERDYVDRVRALVRTERPFLMAALQALGLRVIHGEANFLLFQCKKPLSLPLRERGILIRGCADFHGLDESWYRCAVRTREENERLIAVLKEVLT